MPGDSSVIRPESVRKRTEDSILPRRRILVVDDNEDAAEMLALMLACWGQETQVANDGLSALAAARAFRPDVVLLDIGLPGMSGYEIARHLRELPAAESILLVAVTGWGQDTDKQQSRDAGFDEHLVKPVDPDTLRTLLTRP